MPPIAAEADVTADRVIASFEALPQLVAADADLLRRGHFLTCDMEIGVGRMPLAVTIVSGRVMSVARGPFLLRSSTFSVRADPDVWQRFHAPVPAPGFHDLMALSKFGRARIDGNLVPLMGNLQYVKDLLALPRRLPKPGAAR